MTSLLLHHYYKVFNSVYDSVDLQYEDDRVLVLTYDDGSVRYQFDRRAPYVKHWTPPHEYPKSLPKNKLEITLAKDWGTLAPFMVETLEELGIQKTQIKTL